MVVAKQWMVIMELRGDLGYRYLEENLEERD